MSTLAIQPDRGPAIEPFSYSADLGITSVLDPRNLPGLDNAGLAQADAINQDALVLPDQARPGDEGKANAARALTSDCPVPVEDSAHEVAFYLRLHRRDNSSTVFSGGEPKADYVAHHRLTRDYKERVAPMAHVLDEPTIHARSHPDWYLRAERYFEFLEMADVARLDMQPDLARAFLSLASVHNAPIGREESEPVGFGLGVDLGKESVVDGIPHLDPQTSAGRGGPGAEIVFAPDIGRAAVTSAWDPQQSLVRIRDNQPAKSIAWLDLIDDRTAHGDLSIPQERE